MLDLSPMVEAAIDMFTEGILRGKPSKDAFRQLQAIGCIYASQGVKRIAGEMDKELRLEKVRQAYKDVVVPGLLKCFRRMLMRNCHPGRRFT